MASIPVSEERELTLAERFLITMDLAEAGVEMMRAKLAREHPDADAADIQRLLVAWMQERPGAEHGDAAGRPAAERFADG